MPEWLMDVWQALLAAMSSGDAAGLSGDEFSWHWPWLFWLLPLPLLGALLPPAQAPNQRAVALPFWADLAGHGVEQRRGRWAWRVFGLLLWLLLVTAAARPQFVGEIQQLPISGRDLLLAVDISGSMDTADMVVGQRQVSRFDAVKIIAGDFIQRRAGDRTGLILFGSRAYLQVPLTFDRETAATVLRDAQIGLAGKQTAIGDAIGLAVKRLRENPSDEQVLILLTDGANTAGALEPVQAAEFAGQAGLKIYTIGIGADRMRVRDVFGTRLVNPSADLDEASLQRIADLTGGRYFRARDPQALNQIYTILDDLEPVAEDQQTLRPVSELFHWPLGLAVLLSLLAAGLKALPPLPWSFGRHSGQARTPTGKQTALGAATPREGVWKS